MTDKQQQLLAAIKDQSPGNVKVALAAGADPNAYADDRSMLSWHESKAGLLLEYEQPTWLDILEALLVAGANPNLSTDQRFEEFLLHSLSQGSILTAMRLVLDHGADPNLLCEGDTALNWLDSDYCYEETCNLPAWYKGRVLPEYEATPDDLDDYETAAIWLVARHQRGWAMLRQAGGLCSWELTQGPVSEILALTPDRLGGLYTRHARPDASFLVSLGRALNERIARWTRDYLNPSLLGYDAHAVRRFNYAPICAKAWLSVRPLRHFYLKVWNWKLPCRQLRALQPNPPGSMCTHGTLKAAPGRRLRIGATVSRPTGLALGLLASCVNFTVDKPKESHSAPTLLSHRAEVFRPGHVLPLRRRQ